MERYFVSACTIERQLIFLPGTIQVFIFTPLQFYLITYILDFILFFVLMETLNLFRYNF